MTGKDYKTFAPVPSAPPPGTGPANVSTIDGGSDNEDYFDVDPGFDQAILSFDLDTAPGPGYCAVPWYPNSHHSGLGRDVRWEANFKSFLIIRSSKNRAGGVYTDRTDVEFALQGLHPTPEFQEMSSFLDCLELWKADCRAGVHEHPPPTSKSLDSPQKTPRSHAPTAALTSTPPNSRCASPFILRSPHRLTGTPPSTPPSARRENHSAKVLSPSPVTPYKARGPSSPLNPATAERRAPKPSPAALIGAPASVAASPRTPHASGTGYRGPPPPYPSPLCGSAASSGAQAFMAYSSPSPPVRPLASTSMATPHASTSVMSLLAPTVAPPTTSPSAASSSAMSRSTSGRSGPDSTSTFIPPVWFSQDSKGLGLILTSSWAYARELRAMHGNIDVVTDSNKLNSVVQQFFKD